MPPRSPPPPPLIDRGHNSFWVNLSVHLFVCFSAKFGVFLCHMGIPCDKTFLVVPTSRSSVKVKVKYQGDNFQKISVVGAFMFTKHISFPNAKSPLLTKYGSDYVFVSLKKTAFAVNMFTMQKGTFF